MKKLMFLVLALFALNVNAQTKIRTLKRTIRKAPKNEYGVKRVDYGIWDTTQTHIWAFYDKKEGFVLCKSTGGISLATTPISKRSDNALIQEVRNELKPENWNPIKW